MIESKTGGRRYFVKRSTKSGNLRSDWTATRFPLSMRGKAKEGDQPQGRFVECSGTVDILMQHIEFLFTKEIDDYRP